MWRWYRTAGRHISSAQASEVPRTAQRVGECQQEATERRSQLAVAEATARAKDLIRRHSEACDERIAHANSHIENLIERFREVSERRIQLALNHAIAYAEDRCGEIARNVRDQRLGEASESRIQLAFNQGIAYAEQRCNEIAREVRDQRQHIPAFLNAVATVPAFAYELSSLRAELELAKTDCSLVSRQLDDLQERVEMRFRNSSIEKDSNLKTLHAKAENAVAEFQRLQEMLADVQTDRANLWRSAEGATRGIGDLWQRLEFVRNEIMYEMRYGRGSGFNKPDRARPLNRIVAEDKVTMARNSGDIRLNLGCGHIPMQGYLNVDFRELPGVDIVADAAELPFDPGSVSEIISSHVLEHFPQEQLRRLLPYWRSLLKQKGSFRAVVPDGEAMLAHQADGTYSFEDFRMVLFGAQEYEGDFHFNMFTPEYLGKALGDAGFDKITYPVKGRKNDICFEFEVLAINP